MESRVNIIDYKPIKRNNLCHWCNKNKENKKIKYIDCNFCIQTYCAICIMKLPHIKPNDKGCLYCQKLCGCILNNLNHCYKTRINILVNNIKSKQYNSFSKIVYNKSLEISDKTTIYDLIPFSNVLDENKKRKSFTIEFDTTSLYILDSSSNVCLKPYKKRKFIKHTDI